MGYGEQTHLLTGFSFSFLFCEVLLLVAVNVPGSESSVGCAVVGFLLHYFCLQGFIWLAMLPLSIYQQLEHKECGIGQHALLTFVIAAGKVYSGFAFLLGKAIVDDQPCCLRKMNTCRGETV